MKKIVAVLGILILALVFGERANAASFSLSGSAPMLPSLTFALNDVNPGTVAFSLNSPVAYSFSYSLCTNVACTAPSIIDSLSGIRTGLLSLTASLVANTTYYLQFAFNSLTSQNVAYSLNVSYQVAATPIPAALLLFVSALGGLGFAGYRRRKLSA
jgi:hypothetical protein